MKRFLLCLLGTVLITPLWAKMVKPRITVLIPGQDIQSVLYRDSIEARVMEGGSVILVHGDSLSADPTDPLRFLAITGLDGLVLGEVTDQGLEIRFYSSKGLISSLNLPLGEDVSRYDQAALVISQKITALYPEKEQTVVVKEEEIRQTVSPLEYYRPQLGIGLLLFSLKQDLAFYFYDGSETHFSTSHFSPSLNFYYDYSWISFSAEFQYYRGEATKNTTPLTTYGINPALRLEIRPGFWIARGLLNLNLGIEYDYLNYQMQSTNTVEHTIQILRLIPQLRIRFTDKFMFGISGVGFNLIPAANRSPESTSPLFQFTFTWDFQVHPHWRVLLQTTLFSTPFSNREMFGSTENQININRNTVGVGFVYQWNPGGKK